ncbi:flagellin [Metabacillus sp. GX 13764]|uniref:flagellin N-terminal helical domain-containing protein n=1 Tax=Metabacillus kandeliae TaxID=2900151 RepID=UPI001E42C502|nr:flagellin [Metabacillus kandeliae]MCD7034444.1 flagellin [Metabacillus kandeliae]
MRINHNIAALNTYRQLNTASTGQSKSMEKLSSGLRINRAGDDAAGLAISEKMRGQIRGLDQASKNSQDAISLVQTAEGALNETHDILQRMRELATQAANDTNVGADRTEIQKEINQLTSEVNRIGNTTEFNTRKLLNGSSGGTGVAGTKGTDTLAIGTALVAGESFNVDGVKFTVKAAGAADYTKNELEAGADATAQAENLARALQNSSLSDKYDVTTNTGTLTFTQKEGFESATALTATIDSASGGVTLTNTGTGAEGTDGKLTMQIGANGGQTFVVDIKDMRADAQANGMKLSGTGTVSTDSGKTAVFVNNAVTNGTDDNAVFGALDVSTAANASAAIDAIDDSIKAVSGERSKLGAYQNRLEHTINNLNTSSENLTAAESRIRDVDMAKEMMNQTKNSILSQAAQAMLAQANSAPQGVLQLLR